jgi:hypothetical protein
MTLFESFSSCIGQFLLRKMTRFLASGVLHDAGAHPASTFSMVLVAQRLNPMNATAKLLWEKKKGMAGRFVHGLAGSWRCRCKRYRCHYRRLSLLASPSMRLVFQCSLSSGLP